MRTARWFLAPLVALAFILVACGDGEDDGTGAGTPGAPTRVTLWHSMSQPLEGALQRIVQQFNESQSQYRVEAIFQGSYTQSLQKLRNSVGSGDIPALIQLDDVSTQIMIESGVITPVQEFIDEEDYDLSDFEPKALAYYTVDDTLYSMPFNLAGPILYYDKEAFAAAGLDPDAPPTTLEEVRQYSARLVQRNERGEVTRFGIALQISPWMFEQMLAKQGALYVNNNNGRDGRATEAVFDSPEGQRIIQWYDEMVDSGLALNAGRSSTDAVLALATGRAVMAMESTALLGVAVAVIVQAGEDPNRLGTGPLPAPEGEGGIVLGGASLWILSERPEEEQRGAWEFIKFATSPEQQARWHADTGYFPMRLSAYDLPAAVKKQQDFPQFRTAIDQLRASPDTPATRGALLGPFTEVRERVAAAFERVLVAGADPAQALEQAADEATEEIEEYNETTPE